MRKVVVAVYATIDGVMSPIDWTGGYVNPEHGPYARKLLFESDALVMGRETFEIFASSWGSQSSANDGPGEEGFIDRINSLPKYVASTTLQEPLAWNSTLIHGDVAEAVAKLKEQPGLNILIYGAGPVARMLLEHGLVDELRVWLYPVVAGEGERLFNGKGALTYFQLVKSEPFSSGVVVHTFVPNAQG